jgi:hypothetical protein
MEDACGEDKAADQVGTPDRDGEGDDRAVAAPDQMHWPADHGVDER